MEDNANNIEIILQDCLAKIRSGEETLDSALAHYPQKTGDLRPLLEAALWIQSRQDALQPRPGFASSSRRRLVEHIQQEQFTEPTSENMTWWENILKTLSTGFQQKRLAAQLVTALALVLALLLTAGGTGIARASQDALPGDLLYGVKRTIEKAELALTPDEAGKAEVYIKNARNRLEEVQSLLEENRTEHIGETVSLFEDQVYRAVSIIVIVRDQDNVKAKALAGELNSILQEESTAVRNLAASSQPEVNREIDRLLSVSDGMVVLIGDRIPLVAATATIAPTSTSTPGIAVVVPSVTAPLPSATTVPPSTSTPGIAAVPSVTAPLPSATSTQPPSPIVVNPTEPGSIPTLAWTATVTPTISNDAGEKKPTHTPKKTDKPHKPKKTPKPHPKPHPKPDQ